ncbi:hypothetical protein HDV63DRAFT_366582 [Trichoderma sp. SZMC 28014]
MPKLLSLLEPVIHAVSTTSRENPWHPSAQSKPQRHMKPFPTLLFPFSSSYVSTPLSLSCPLHLSPATGNASHPRLDNRLALDVARDGLYWLKMAAAGKPLVFLLLVEGLLRLEGYDVIDVSTRPKQSASQYCACSLGTYLLFSHGRAESPCKSKTYECGHCKTNYKHEILYVPLCRCKQRRRFSGPIPA